MKSSAVTARAAQSSRPRLLHLPRRSRIARVTRRCPPRSLTATNIVSSPAMVPTTSDHARRSIATATRFASPGAVCTTTRISPAVSQDKTPSAIRCSSGSATLRRPGARRYAPSTFARPSTAMSRLTEDWVTSQPSAASMSASSSCVCTARVLMSSRMRRCRFLRSAVPRDSLCAPPAVPLPR